MTGNSNNTNGTDWTCIIVAITGALFIAAMMYFGIFAFSL